MIILQGIDLLKIERIKNIYLNYGDRFLEKILTHKEIEQITNHKQIYNKIASKFSAKRLHLRLWGTGFAQGVKIKTLRY